MSARTRGIRAPGAGGRTGARTDAAGDAGGKTARGRGGHPGLLNAPGFGTKLAEDKDTRDFDGREYVLERGIKADVSIIKAGKDDTLGNPVFRKTLRNFNPMIATCGKVTVAEVAELVEPETINPDHVHTPGIYVDRIVKGAHYEKRIEFRTVSGAAASKKDSPMREIVAKRAAKELRDGNYVNLGIGIPTLVGNHIPQGMTVTLQSENGLLGIGPSPTEDKVDPDLIAGKQTITTLPASRFFSSADSFAMIRAAMSTCRSSAGWKWPATAISPTGWCRAKMVKGPGGAMDLVSGVRRVIVLMEHTARDGSPKILKECSLPVTGKGVVNMIITDLYVFEVVRGKGLVLKELHPGVTLEDVKAKTGCPFSS